MIERAHEANGILSLAIYSDCGAYRYLLTRDWGAGPRVAFVMLNPSTADERANDATIERCQRRAATMGGGLIVVNLFGFRATRPADLKAAADPVGTDNDAVLLEALRKADRIICGWGFHGAHQGRGEQIAKMLRAEGLALLQLGLTKDGHPRHPLYLSYRIEPQIWAD
ncbi:MAG: DUF1643 domain-containing protein [Paracoccus sp. (in: a-proteobacteria)]|nr:DUF1643 domain-containing protein [Paracoccus sp. (in: a-proteobacteria)]